MFATIIRALLGAIGIIKKTKKFTTENNDAFMKSLRPCSVICLGKIKQTFVDGGIKAATNSFYSHTLLYVGKTAGEMIRRLYPELLANDKIPAEAKIHETVEALAKGISVSTLDKDFSDNQMVAYIRPITVDEMIKILLRAYSDVGKPYDYTEFVGDAFPSLPIPNPQDLNCCASGVTKWWMPVERIVKIKSEGKKIDASRATPAQVNEYLESNLKWEQTKYNW